MAAKELFGRRLLRGIGSSMSSRSLAQKIGVREFGAVAVRVRIPKVAAIINRSDNCGRRNYGVFEPDYLDAGKSEIPVYDLLNLQIKGYDFPVLEKYARYVHHTAERVGINVDEAWPTPCKVMKVTKLKPESNAVDSEYPLHLYERNVQLTDVPSTLLPLLINVVEAALPAGVTLRVHPHIPEHEETRYVPDLELKKLQSELDEMGGSKKPAYPP